MNFSLFADTVTLKILNSIGAIALFLFGMKIMSDGTQRIAGKQLRRFLDYITQKNITALFAGLGLTTAVQSSSAMSVFTLSFVNSGLLQLQKAFALLIGANIGTTLKLWVISLGYEFDFSMICLPLIALAIPFYFSKNIKHQGWAVFTIGFSLIFIGLGFLQTNLHFLTESNVIYDFLSQSNTITYYNSLVFLLIGLGLTLLIQSSSASTSIIIILYGIGTPLELCAMMILGANIGTASTAVIASYVGNIYSKITAYFHLFFNIFGVIVFFFITPFLIRFFTSLFPSPEKILSLAAFHTTFNLVTGALVFPFVDVLAKKIIAYLNKYPRYKNQSSENLMLSFSYTISPEMFIYEANKRLLSFAGNIKQSISILGRLITESDDNKFEQLHQRILTLEKEGDVLEKDILQNLNEIYGLSLSSKHAKHIHSIVDISNELENIGDLCIKMSYTYQLRRQTNSYITPKLRTHLLEMQDLVSLATTHLIQNINDTESDSLLYNPQELEERTNTCLSLAFATLTKSIDKGKLKPVSGLYYRDLIHNYEIISDHLFKANKILVR